MAVKRTGDILLEVGLITPEQLSTALKEKQPGERVGETLTRLGYVSEAQILKVLEQSTGVQRISLAKYSIDENALKLVNEDFARRKLVLPLKVEGNHIHVAINDPLDYGIGEDIRIMTGYKPKLFSATKQEIESAIEKYYGFSKTLEALGVKNNNQIVESSKMIQEINQKVDEDNADVSVDEETPMVQLVNQILASAVFQRASDIHIDPHDKIIAVRYRIDGVLDTVREIPIKLLSQLISRIKVMSGLDITESRIPQDGRIRTMINGKNVDLRISTLPTVRGEKVVMRILDLSGNTNRVENIGLDPDGEAIVRDMIAQANGIILVSGPTGSGKTTTLYACLNELNTPGVNIITVEDPVEIRVEGINQVQTQAEIGMTFASALRSILRQDPNIVMIGEIRDKETADIAVRASLTGHLVLSTIHTNDAIKTVTRLLDMGVEPFMISSSLTGVIAQRLVRRLCDECQYEDDVTEYEKSIFESHGMHIERVKRAKGCASCNQKGYHGRLGIFEILRIDDTLRRLINENATVIELAEAAKKAGLKSLLQYGLEKAAEGYTSVEEVLKVACE